VRFADNSRVTATSKCDSEEDCRRQDPDAGPQDENEKRFRKITIRNLEHLKGAGIELAVGTDTTPGAGAHAEVNFLRETGVFSNLELLKMWSETTPKVIFPQRKIGTLKEGYEANFLVLGGSPIEDFSEVTRIRMRVKQGEALN
jgi:imidazolonepropionase-like amidohydrolase